MTHSSSSLEGGENSSRIVGPYRLETLIGSGGMGEVYRAYDQRLERRVAIKHIHPERESDDNARRRLRREAQAAAALAHPSIVQVFDILEEKDGEWIVMEWIEGPSLAHRLEAGPLPISTALRVAREVAEGLAYAHTEGFIHRDLKTENVILSPLGQAKILDFGLVKRLGRDEESLTQDGSVVGTSRAMSPEQAQGFKVDARSDLFSLGVLIYECLTGRSPFKADSAVATLTRVCTHRQRPVHELNPEVPQELERLVDRLLKKLPEMRPRSASHAVDELSTISRQLERTTSIARGKPIAESETIDFVAAEDLPPNSLEPPSKGQSRGSQAASWRTIVRAIPAAFLLVLFLPTVILPEFRGLLVNWLMNPSDPLASPLETFPDSFRQDLRQDVDSESDPLRIVVLPFESLGPPTNAYFAAGMTEEISRRLTQLSGLGVISRTSAARYADAGLNAQQIGLELNVAYILEGTVNWPPASSDEGSEEIRITPRLIRVADDLQIWTGVYERTPGNFLGLQAEIASEVAARLDLRLRQTERQALEARGTEVPAAYFAFLRGLDYRNQTQFSMAGLRKAASMFRHAVEKDDTFADSYAELSRVHSQLYFNNDPSKTRRQDAGAALQRALELDAESLATRLAAAFFSFYVENDYQRAATIFAEAAQALPQNAEVLAGLAQVKRRQGKLEEAVPLFAESFSLDRANAGLATDIAETYRALRDYEAADKWFAIGLELAPDFTSGVSLLAINALTWKGCPSPSAGATGCSTRVARQILEDSPISDDPNFYYTWLLFDMYDATLASRREAEMQYAKIVDRITSMPSRPGGPGEGCYSFLYEAIAYERLGHLDRARALVDTCREESEAMLESKGESEAILGRLGIAYAYLGRRDEALAIGQRGVELASEDRFLGPRNLEYLAITHALLGDHEQALGILENLMATSYRDPIDSAGLRLDPIWDPLRDSQRFQNLIMRRRPKPS